MVTTRTRSFWTNFTKGALSDRVQGRPDLEAYRNAAKQLDNWRILMEGGITRRPGTTYVADLTSLSNVRTEAFVFNYSQAYIFVFANTTLDIYQEDGTYVGQLTSQPWTTAMLPDLRVTQAFDTMIVCHEDMPSRKIVRTGATTFTSTAFAFEVASAGYPTYQPYYKYADEAMTLTPSATTGSITLTTSAAYWNASHVGSIVRYEGKECTLDSYSSTTVINATVLDTLGGTAASADWDIAAFNPVNGYPRIPMFFKQRLLFGGSKELPHVLFGSKIEAFYNFDVGTGLANEALFHAIYENQVGLITSMDDAGNLVIKTDSAEYWNEISASNPFAPANINFQKTTSIGSLVSATDLYDKAVLFLTRGGNSIQELRFSDAYKSYASNQLGTLSKDSFSSPTRIEILKANSDTAESYALFLNDDGTLGVFHSIAAEDIGGWTKWIFDGNGSDSLIDICAVNDTLYIVASRSINGSTKLYLEKVDYTMTVDSAIALSAGDATNLLTFPNDLDNAAWTKSNCSITANAATDPDLTALADEIIEDSATSTHYIYQSYAGFTSGNKYTVEGFFKQGVGDRNVVLELPNAAFPASCSATFDLELGQILSEGAGADAVRLTAWDNGWYFCEVDGTCDSTTAGNVAYYMTSGATSSYAGDGTSSIYGYGLKLHRTPLSVWTGLSHLNGEVVHAIQGSYYLGSYTVSSNQIDTSPFTGYDVTIGLIYTPTGKTLRPEVQLDDGPSHGELRSVTSVVFDLENCLSLKVDVDDLLFVRDVDDDLSNDPTAFTGSYEVMGLGWDFDGYVTFTQDVPLSCTINNIVVEVMI